MERKDCGRQKRNRRTRKKIREQTGREEDGEEWKGTNDGRKDR